MPQEPRRDALKIIGAIGTTCLFPFPSAELYGQHEPHGPAPEAPAYQRQFFKDGEFAILTALVDEIIPATDTPGASEARVPEYIDMVLTKNKRLGAICREGLRALHKHQFLAMGAPERQAYLEKLCESAERAKKPGPRERFWVAIKSLTADGYYTSKAGMVAELGFTGGSVLAAYPNCEVPEH